MRHESGLHDLSLFFPKAHDATVGRRAKLRKRSGQMGAGGECVHHGRVASGSVWQRLAG